MISLFYSRKIFLGDISTSVEYSTSKKLNNSKWDVKRPYRYRLPGYKKWSKHDIHYTTGEFFVNFFTGRIFFKNINFDSTLKSTFTPRCNLLKKIQRLPKMVKLGILQKVVGIFYMSRNFDQDTKNGQNTTFITQKGNFS
jgi:hypothetical protein